jgi:ribosomal protein L37AE/L43A
VSREIKANSKFICELCSKKAGMVIKEYRTGRWLCYDCYFRKKVSKGTGEALLKGGE